MEKIRYDVTFKAGYDDLTFSFDEYEKAVEFAKIGMATLQAHSDSKGDIMRSTVTIEMMPVTIVINEEVKKEETENELAVQA